jgi:hypothetical protein
MQAGHHEAEHPQQLGARLCEREAGERKQVLAPFVRVVLLLSSWRIASARVPARDTHADFAPARRIGDRERGSG